MKKIIIYLVLTIAFISFAGAVDNITNVQGIAINRTSGLEVNGSDDINITFQDSSGSDYWTENQTRNIEGGRWSMVLGLNTVLNYSIVRNFVNATVSVAGEESSTLRIAKGFWAFVADYALDSDKLDGYDSSFFIDLTTATNASGKEFAQSEDSALNSSLQNEIVAVNDSQNAIKKGNTTTEIATALDNGTILRVNGQYFNNITNFTSVFGDGKWCRFNATNYTLVCDITPYTNFGASIDDTELTSESFGEFTCDGTEDGCTLDNNALDDQYFELSDKVGNTSDEIAVSLDNSTIARTKSSLFTNVTNFTSIRIDGNWCRYNATNFTFACDVTPVTGATGKYVTNNTNIIAKNFNVTENLTVNGGNITFPQFSDCTLKTDTSGHYVCGTDNTAAAGSFELNYSDGKTVASITGDEVMNFTGNGSIGIAISGDTLFYWFDNSSLLGYINSLKRGNTSGEIATAMGNSTIVRTTDNPFTNVTNFTSVRVDGSWCRYNGTNYSYACDITPRTDFGATIDDTEMTSESFGDFTCTGAEDGCTLNTGSVGDNEIDYTDVTLTDLTNDVGYTVNNTNLQAHHVNMTNATISDGTNTFGWHIIGGNLVLRKE